ncbi:GNAT family N-acetyltransferase [Tessaracoccus rhinocerotis]|uniref:GNAT family N-acetyltransferase n=1 Tax=Tessaracoccus rhinocerotis TaxID=1689449 RepID=A0A553JXS0_9ACTN|nr:GNAT family N-acetyltransferase [Tessaracoccus rhinocerotis]
MVAGAGTSSGYRREGHTTGASGWGRPPVGDYVGLVHTIDKAFADLTTRELYEILRLRVDVFVVEQACAYPELDGHDLVPTTRHVWIPGDAATGPIAYLRVLRASEALRIGRVVTHPDSRGRGLARMLLRSTVEAHADERIDIDAQAHLTAWYEQFGFRVSGDEFLDFGIPHLPMTRMPR